MRHMGTESTPRLGRDLTSELVHVANEFHCIPLTMHTCTHVGRGRVEGWGGDGLRQHHCHLSLTGNKASEAILHHTPLHIGPSHPP